jgi:hypothetical protein
MSRIRRYLVPALLLLPVIFICGKVLLTPVQHPVIFYVGPYDYDFESGWPWSFMQCQANWNSNLPVIQPGVCVYFSGWWLAIDIVIVIFVVALAGFLLWRWGARRMSPRYSLRFLLMLTVVAALGCAWWRGQIDAYRHEQELVKSLPAEQINCRTACSAPCWLQKLWPTRMPDFFDRVVSIACVRINSLRPDPLQCGPLLQNTLPQFPYLRMAVLDGDVVAQLGNVSEFPTIEKAEFHLAGRVNHAVHLRQFPRLKEVAIDFTPDFAVNQQILRELAKLSELKTLNIRSGEITDAGMEMLARFPVLESLSMNWDEKITDSGVRHLLESSTLSFVDFVEVPVSQSTRTQFETRKPPVAFNDTYEP